MADDFRKHGPYGNRNRENWNLKLGSHEKINAVHISCGSLIDAVGFVVGDETGKTITRRFGGDGGHLHEINLKPSEYITEINGKHGFFEVKLQRLVASITVHTNLNPEGYGPYACETKCVDMVDFSISLPSSCFDFVQFFGRYTLYLESIGSSIKRTTENLGPWGNLAPPNWEFQLQVYDRITEIIISVGFIVDRIVFDTLDNHGNLNSRGFGGGGGGQQKIQLRHDEHITNISGKYGYYKLGGSEVVLGSITFHSNIYPLGYGPYGDASHCTDVREFSSRVPSNHRIVGFYGRGSRYIDSIGVCIKRF